MTTKEQIEKVLRRVPRFAGVYLYDEINNIKSLHDKSSITLHSRTRMRDMLGIMYALIIGALRLKESMATLGFII